MRVITKSIQFGGQLELICSYRVPISAATGPVNASSAIAVTKHDCFYLGCWKLECVCRFPATGRAEQDTGRSLWDIQLNKCVIEDHGNIQKC